LCDGSHDSYPTAIFYHNGIVSINIPSAALRNSKSDASRKDAFTHTHTHNEILDKYGSRIVLCERMPDIFSAATGNQCTFQIDSPYIVNPAGIPYTPQGSDALLNRCVVKLLHRSIIE
jgi:hypothetical protein